MRLKRDRNLAVSGAILVNADHHTERPVIGMLTNLPNRMERKQPLK